MLTQLLEQQQVGVPPYRREGARHWRLVTLCVLDRPHFNIVEARKYVHMRKIRGMHRTAVKAEQSRNSYGTRQAPDFTFSRPHGPPLPSRLDVYGSGSTRHTISTGGRQHHSAQATSETR